MSSPAQIARGVWRVADPCNEAAHKNPSERLHTADVGVLLDHRYENANHKCNKQIDITEPDSPFRTKHRNRLLARKNPRGGPRSQDAQVPGDVEPSAGRRLVSRSLDELEKQHRHEG